MAFDFAIPKANYKADAIRGLDGELIHTLKKVRPARRKTKLGALNRRHISEGEETRKTGEFLNGRQVVARYEHTYHATEGWRSRRVPA